MESILTSVKKMLGISEEYEHFDPDIIMHINSVFLILNQMGVGPDECYFIMSKDEKWEDFIPDNSLNMVKSYMFMKVKLLFDPPSSSTVMEASNRMISEFEWRLTVAAENKKSNSNESGSSSDNNASLAKLGEAMLGLMKLGYAGASN